jgi:hypothetical protein
MYEPFIAIIYHNYCKKAEIVLKKHKELNIFYALIELLEYLYKFNARKMINTVTEKKIIGYASELFNN